MPPVHDEVSALGHFGPGAAQGLGIPVAQGSPHRPRANERWVADDEIGRWPRGLARVDVAPLHHLRRFVWHLLARHRVGLGGAAVPAGNQLPVAIDQRLLAVKGQHGVAAFDVAVVVHHGFSHPSPPDGADVPLQKPDPQHQLGQRGSAVVDFNAQELLQRDRFAAHVQRVLCLAQCAQLVQHLAFQPLQVLQRHVQEIGAAAGRVQHAQRAQAVQKTFHLLSGFLPLGAHRRVVPVECGKVLLGFHGGRVGFQGAGLLRQRQCGHLHVGPLGAQGFNHRGHHQAFNIGAGGVVRTQRVAFAGVQRALQQRAKDGGLYVTPVGARGFNQVVDLFGIEQQAVGNRTCAFEELAVEAQHGLDQGGAKAALVHVGPQITQHLLQHGGVIAMPFQQLVERTLGQQLGVFGKHAEDAARQVGRHVGRAVARQFERTRQLGKVLRHRPRNLGADQRRVQGVGVGPDQAQALASFWQRQVGQCHAVAARVRKGCVGAAAAAELGIDLEHGANVHHQQEGWAAFFSRQGPGIVFGLGTRLLQAYVKSFRVTAGLQLLGFQHKVATAVAISTPRAGAAVAVGKGDGPLKHVVLSRRGVGLGYFKQVTQVHHERLSSGQFTGRDVLPARYKCPCVIVAFHGAAS